MYFISSVKKMDNKRKCVELDESIKFPLYLSEVKKYSIEESGSLDEGTYEIIRKQILIPRCRERVFYMLKDSDKSEHDVRKKLTQGYYPNDVIDNIIDFMKNNNYLNDERYANLYIENKIKQKSINIIRQELCMLHGVERTLIDNIIDEHNYIENNNEKQIIENTFIKKKYNFELEDLKEKNKIIGSLLRKGFAYDTIINIYQQLKNR